MALGRGRIAGTGRAEQIEKSIVNNEWVEEDSGLMTSEGENQKAPAVDETTENVNEAPAVTTKEQTPEPAQEPKQMPSQIKIDEMDRLTLRNLVLEHELLVKDLETIKKDFEYKNKDILYKAKDVQAVVQAFTGKYGVPTGWAFDMDAFQFVPNTNENKK